MIEIDDMVKPKRMTVEQRKALQARVAKRVEKEGLVQTATSIPVTYATLRRFLAGANMHESTLQQIAAKVPR